MSLPVIETRDQLLSMLAEAAELEHNLMCLYLYAVFSFKSEESEGLSSSELQMVNGWRDSIMEVCIQEMSHLALVSNLSTAVGGNAHLLRGNFPIKSGFFPADFVIELSPFDMATLEHFIFLERSSDSPLEDSEAVNREDYSREAPRNRLMTHGGDYSTVGELYECIKTGIMGLNKKLGQERLFCGDFSLQLTTDDVGIPGMDVIKDEGSALKAIDRIVEEGEGGTGGDSSHFQKFCRIKAEYEEAVTKNPKFSPARPAARNPVMRKPAGEEDVIWINHPASAPVLDLVNALYDLMIRCLTLLYAGGNRPEEDRKGHLSLTFALMTCLAESAKHLTRLPANSEMKGVNINAGASFATNRHFMPPLARNENIIMEERLEDILEKCKRLPPDVQGRVEGRLRPEYQRVCKARQRRI